MHLYLGFNSDSTLMKLARNVNKRPSDNVWAAMVGAQNKKCSNVVYFVSTKQRNW